MKLIEYQGKKQTLAKWSKELNIGYPTLYARLKNGWSVFEAFNVNCSTTRCKTKDSEK